MAFPALTVAEELKKNGAENKFVLEQTNCTFQFFCMCEIDNLVDFARLTNESIINEFINESFVNDVPNCPPRLNQNYITHLESMCR